MASDPRPLRPPRDRVKITTTPEARRVQWLLGAGLAALGVAAFVVVRLTRDARPGRAAIATAPEPRARLQQPEPAAMPSAPAAKPRPVRRTRRHDAPKKEEMPFTLLQPGERAGLAVFPPPGTKPIKRGIIVPEGFELPPGYVRHYQTTDDGRRLPPILMFHPDYELVDAQGNPVPVPEDRVVPPEMAPPGLPVQTLDDPEHAGTEGRAR